MIDNDQLDLLIRSQQILIQLFVTYQTTDEPERKETALKAIKELTKSMVPINKLNSDV